MYEYCLAPTRQWRLMCLCMHCICRKTSCFCKWKYFSQLSIPFCITGIIHGYIISQFARSCEFFHTTNIDYYIISLLESIILMLLLHCSWQSNIMPSGLLSACLFVFFLVKLLIWAWYLDVIATSVMDIDKSSHRPGRAPELEIWLWVAEDSH